MPSRAPYLVSRITHLIFTIERLTVLRLLMLSSRQVLARSPVGNMEVTTCTRFPTGPARRLVLMDMQCQSV